jgi:hexosaminidase
LNLLPCPRSLKLCPGTLTLPKRATIHFDPNDAALLPIVKRLQTDAKEIGVELILGSARASRAVSSALAGHIIVRRTKNLPTDEASVGTREGARAPRSEGYGLTIDKNGIQILFREIGGLHAAVATLRQLLRQYGRRLPCLKIRDWPDFARRGVMLDISRGRVPKLETLLELVEHLADFKINEFQLYTEHTFAYRRYQSVWQSWGALTGEEIRKLDARCQQLGIDLVPNQNSFGHLRYFLEHPRLKKLAEVSGPYPDYSGEFVRRPSTLAPDHPGTLPFLRKLYDELLPNFSSQFFNVGCDETWDLSHGRSKKLCAAKGRSRIYLDFLKQIHREVSARGKRTMFWGDIILKYPRLIKELHSFGSSRRESAHLLQNFTGGQSGLTSAATLNCGKIIALNWGYEADHPYNRETALFAKAKIPFYVCPGTSTWQTLIGRHDNALANLRAAAKAGKRFGAMGYLITDWGDGGHPQPLAVSYLPYLAGASLSWCAKTFDEAKLVPVLSRDVFHDPTGNAGKAALALGRAHRKLKFTVPNETPLGTVIAAPPPEQHELFCRNGLKYHARISGKNIRATLKEIEKQRALLKMGRRHTVPPKAKILALELDLAARMAAQSCQFMLWQQARAAGKNSEAKRLARTGIRELRKLEKDFNAYWPLRNKATPKHCSAFLRWRIQDYRKSLNFSL